MRSKRGAKVRPCDPLANATNSEADTTSDHPFRDPDSIDAKLDAYRDYQGESIAWCLLCNRPIVDETELISKKFVIHNCRQGRALAALTAKETGIALPPLDEPAPDTKL